MHNLALLGVGKLSNARISGFLIRVGVLQEVGIVVVGAIAVDDVLLSVAIGRDSSWAVIVVHMLVVVLEVRHGERFRPKVRGGSVYEWSR